MFNFARFEFSKLLTSNTEPYEPVPSVFPVGTTRSKKYCCNLESLLKVLNQVCLLAIVKAFLLVSLLSGISSQLRKLTPNDVEKSLSPPRPPKNNKDGSRL